MTDTALGIRRDMIRNLAGGDAGVMALRTIVGVDTEVVIEDTGKGSEISDRMTARAVLGGRHMVKRFADRDIIVMT